MSAMNEVVVGKFYQAKYKIGSGSFGEIYLGVDLRTSEKCAIKVESKDTKYPQLLEEFKVYRSLKPAAGLPAVYWCGPSGLYNVMVMELLGDSLETLYNKYDDDTSHPPLIHSCRAVIDSHPPPPLSLSLSPPLPLLL